MEYFPLIKHSLLDNFSLNCGWVELKTDDKQIYAQKEYKFGTLKYKNRVGKLSLSRMERKFSVSNCRI